MSIFIYHDLSANKNLVKCISRFETLYLSEIMIWKMQSMSSRAICLCPVLTLSEHFSQLLGGYLYHIQHISLPPPQVNLWMSRVFWVIQDKTEWWWKAGFKNSPTFLRTRNFYIFLFVERCFWLDAPALYHSAPHASIIGALYSSDIYWDLWFIMIYLHQLSSRVSTVMW